MLTHGYSPILKWFPMLGQQEQAFNNLRSAIVKKCHSRLNQFKISSTCVADSVCSILMLDKCSLENVLKILLDSRKNMLETILQGDLRGPTVSTTTLITESIDCLLQTVTHVYQMFCDKKYSHNCYIPKILGEHLNSSSDEAKESKLEENGLESDHIKKVCQSWLSDCQKILANGLTKLLEFVTTSKDLSIIREAVIKMLLAQIKDSKSKDDECLYIDNNNVSRWNLFCLGVFGRGVDLWEEILQSLFVQKVTQIVDKTFEQLLEETKSLTKMNKDDNFVHMVNLNKHLWKEHSDDVTLEMAWKHWQARQKENNLLSSGGGLTLKAMGVTPKIKQACFHTNSIVLKLLDEVSAYCKLEDSKTNLQSSDESEAVYQALQNASYSFSELLLKSLSGQIQYLNSLTDERSEVLAHSLFLNFFCKHFLKLCTGFQKCFFETSETFYNINYFNRTKETTKNEESHAKKWAVITENFNNKANEFMEIWKNKLLDDVLKKFLKKVESSAEQFKLCRWSSTWEKVIIKEESEKGETVESAIHIPSSSSLHVQSLFFEVNHSLQKFGGHSIGNVALEKICKDAFDRYKTTYKTALKNIESNSVKVSQTWALQTLFDIKYIDKMMNQYSIKEDNCNYTEIVNWLENCIDPFDLELFMPYLNQNVNKFASQTCTMYGLLVKKISPLKSSSKSAHNIMPIVPDCGRFVACF